MGFDDPLDAFHRRLLGRALTPSSSTFLQEWRAISIDRGTGVLEWYAKPYGRRVRQTTKCLELPILDPPSVAAVTEFVERGSLNARGHNLMRAHVTSLNTDLPSLLDRTFVVWVPEDADWMTRIRPTILPVWEALAIPYKIEAHNIGHALSVGMSDEEAAITTITAYLIGKITPTPL